MQEVIKLSVWCSSSSSVHKPRAVSFLFFLCCSCCSELYQFFIHKMRRLSKKPNQWIFSLMPTLSHTQKTKAWSSHLNMIFELCDNPGLYLLNCIGSPNLCRFIYLWLLYLLFLSYFPHCPFNHQWISSDSCDFSSYFGVKETSNWIRAEEKTFLWRAAPTRVVARS